MSKYIEIPDDGIIRIPITEDDRTVGERCIDLSDMPTIDAKPVVRGDWDDADNRTEYTVVRCSCCGKGFGKPIAMAVYNFCPNCGADMRGADG